MTLSIRHLSIEYPGKSVFEDVNLEVEPEEVVAVRSGVLDGGSSLLKGIGGLLNGVDGEVLVHGTNLLATAPELLAYRVGFVYEAHGLVSLFNVKTNIALPLYFHANLPASEVDQRVDQVCDQLGLDHSIYRMRPHELNDVETRMVNLARALIVRPVLLLIDELEGGMSDDYLRDTIDAIRAHQKMYPVPTIMTTMSEQIVTRADRAYRIKDRNLVPDAQ